MDLVRILHDCVDGDEDFYCSATSDGVEENGLDWYAWEDCTGPGMEGQAVSCIKFCPFCGLKLAETLGQAHNANPYKFEYVEEEIPDG